jgi:TolB protein
MISPRARGFTPILLACAAAAGACRGPEPMRVLTLPAEDRSPSWSPDGQWLAFEHSGTESTKGLYVARVDGTERRLVVPKGNSPEWSPDGSKLLFGIAYSVHLYTLDLATDSVRQLTDSGFNVHGAWSPDGRSIVFLSDGLAGNGASGLWLMDPDGGSLRRLPFTNTYGGSSSAAEPNWAPTGDRLAIVGFFEPSGGNRIYRVFVGDTITGDTAWLTAPTVGGSQPAWSPTGEWIAYTRVVGSHDEIRLIRPDGSGDHLLFAGGHSPAWSPDGQRVAFSRYTAEECAVWAIDVSGANLQQLTWPRGPTS